MWLPCLLRWCTSLLVLVRATHSCWSAIALVLKLGTKQKMLFTTPHLKQCLRCARCFAGQCKKLVGYIDRTSGNAMFLNLAESAGQLSSGAPMLSSDCDRSLRNLIKIYKREDKHCIMSPTVRSRTASDTVEQIPVVIIGGGVCGLLAADRCLRVGIKFLLFERAGEYGGNWHARANTYSHLQARYRNLGSQARCRGSCRC